MNIFIGKIVSVVCKHLKTSGCDNNMEIQDLTTIFLRSVESVQPKHLFRNCVHFDSGSLVVKGKSFKLQKPCYIVGFGKAVFGMAEQLAGILDKNVKEGVVTVPTGTLRSFDDRSHSTTAPPYSKIKYIQGAFNNLPDKNALKGALAIKELAVKLKRDDLLIVLISGGGSALLPLPRPPVTLSEKLELIKLLANRGADIIDLNCVRKRLSAVKGGGLVKLAYPANVISLILSDVVGDPIDYIASGPTVPNSDSSNAAINIIHKYSLYDQLPDSIKQVLESENQSDGSAIPVSNGKFAHVENFVIGNNKIAAKAALKQASSLGYEAAILSTSITGDVSKLGKLYAELAREVASLISNSSDKRSFQLFLQTFKADLNLSETAINGIINLSFNYSNGICLIAAGEPTVVVTGRGTGGRNQHLALTFSVEVNKFNIKSADISFLSCGTDGIDGPTDAAGAIGTSNLVHNALKENVNPAQFLNNNDSFQFYSKYNCGNYLVHTGHTGTNVMDLHVMIITPIKKM